MKRSSIASAAGFAVENLESRRLMSLTTSVVAVPISQAALTADPSLANYKTFDLQVTLDKGERWIAGDMDAELSKGSFYEVSDANFGSTIALPNFWSSHPANQFDTFVTASNFGRPVVLGTYIPTRGDGGTFTSTSTDVSWGALQDTGTGTITIARLTVSKDAVGTIVGQDSSTETAAAGPAKPFEFYVNKGTVTAISNIRGTVFTDANSNGRRDSGEVGTAGWTVYLDKNNDGKFNSGETSVTTKSDGTYLFDVLPLGTYVVREVVPTGFRRTFPSKTSYTVALTQGVRPTGIDWGNTSRAQLSGTVFKDNNANKKLDSGEMGAVGFTVWLDTNKDGQLDNGESSIVTDSNGNWSFGNVVKGTYLVRIASRSGYKITTPTSFTITLTGGAVSSGHLFGVKKV